MKVSHRSLLLGRLAYNVDGVPPYSTDELTTLRWFLDQYRSTILRQADGLDAVQLNQRLHPDHPAIMTLGGMLKHLAYVEDWWFGVNLAGQPPTPPFDAVDWSRDRDWDWKTAVDHEPAELRAMLTEMIERSDAILGGTESLDTIAVRRHHRTGGGISARWIMVHMIEEYARHAGHADLLREAIDGVTDL